MARLRTIKPGFFVNEELSKVLPLGRLLFAALWCLADREGRLEDRPERIKVEALPYDRCNVDALLASLADHGFIRRYAVAGSRYIEIVNFEKHQKPHPRELLSGIPSSESQPSGTEMKSRRPKLGPAQPNLGPAPDSGERATPQPRTKQSTKTESGVAQPESGPAQPELGVAQQGGVLSSVSPVLSVSPVSPVGGDLRNGRAPAEAPAQAPGRAAGAHPPSEINELISEMTTEFGGRLSADQVQTQLGKWVGTTHFARWTDKRVGARDWLENQVNYLAHGGSNNASSGERVRAGASGRRRDRDQPSEAELAEFRSLT